MDTTVQELNANGESASQVALADAVLESPSPAKSRTAHLHNKRTGRPPGSPSRDPNAIAMAWVALHWQDDDTVPPTKRAQRLYEFARENPDRFLVMLERVRLLRGDRGPVKTCRAPRGATAFPSVRRVKRVLVSREIAEVTCQLPPEAYQQLPEEYKIVELFASKASSDYVMLIESDALSPVDAGGRIPEARLHVPQQKEAHRAATLSPVTIRNLGLKKLTLGWRELETLFKIFTNTNVRQKLPEDFRLVAVDRTNDGSLEFLFGSESFPTQRAGQAPPETGTVALWEQKQREQEVRPRGQPHRR
jgi:hypothetical protein